VALLSVHNQVASYWHQWLIYLPVVGVTNC